MNHRVKRISQFLLIIFLPILLNGQTAEEIISRHIKAHGGIEKWEKVEAIEIKGNYTSFSIEKPYQAIKTKDGKYYGNFYLGEINVIESWDGSKGWTIDPWQEMDFPRAINDNEKNVFLQNAEYFTPFYKYKERGRKVEYMGEEKMDGINCHVLKLTRQNGLYETWYLNAKNYLEYACISQWTDFAYPTQAETYFDDFREIDGLKIPFFIDKTFRARNRILQIEELIINPAYDQSLFHMKRRPEIGSLSFMEGKWKVVVETMARSGQWYPLGEVISNFRFEPENLLREEVSYEKLFPVYRSLQIAYNQKTGSYKMVVFNDLFSELDFFEGSFDENTLECNDLKYQKGDGVQNIQFLIEKIEEGKFIISMNVSNDKGENWNATDRFTYTRY